MKDEQAALIEANREGERLVDALDDIRVTLRDALERGQAILCRDIVAGGDTPSMALPSCPYGSSYP